MAVMLCVPLTVSGRGLLASYNTTRLNSLTICRSVVRVYTMPITHLLLVGAVLCASVCRHFVTQATLSSPASTRTQLL